MSELSELREDIFGVEVKKHVLWEVVKWQLACRRQGTHSTKTRGEVAYSGRKILPQKGTGNARHGDRGAPIFVGGGVAHGPKPRDYYYPLPKKVRKLALKMALSSKAQEKAISLVDQIPIGDVPKTKKAVEFLRAQGLEGKKVLLVLPEKDDVIYKSFRNLPYAKVLPVEGLNVYDILWADHLIITRPSLEKIYERLGS
ncbi:50S ribosomal protein L4 [Thermocrinis ruber]|uniref:Large ribosomal subunit protein uL4 n=1 Tax=Thermocrinis ruber TaxID=75906 RepID=W0DI10_9AQUI|nr:50S ribosomal protein L4 [Thermocrinis ruber]AHE96515.1 50S ribosomal protein L4 [Thermocrinis ruber]